MKFEHTVRETVLGSFLQRELNEMSERGWELVSATHSDSNYFTLFFKRPVE